MRSACVAVVFAALVALSCSQKCEKSQVTCQGLDAKCVGDFVSTPEACVGTAECCKYPFHCIGGLCKEDSTVCKHSPVSHPNRGGRHQFISPSSLFHLRLLTDV